MHRLTAILFLVFCITIYDSEANYSPPKKGKKIEVPLPPPKKAIVSLQGPIVKGNITFEQAFYGGDVTIKGSITGLSPGKHGFHVHAKGDITGGCASTGPHYNPFNVTHGAPDDHPRHVGDLGNILTGADGVTNVDFSDDIITLIGEFSIIGRGLVVHEKEDDLGKTSHPDSKTTGNAGARLACGVIGVA